jgi:hypothetical protein
MFNHERPHEELNNATPGSLYQPKFCVVIADSQGEQQRRYQLAQGQDRRQQLIQIIRR